MFTVRSVMAVTRVIEIFHTRSLIAFDHLTPSIRLTTSHPCSRFDKRRRALENRRFSPTEAGLP